MAQPPKVRNYPSLNCRKVYIPCAITQSTLLSWHNLWKNQDYRSLSRLKVYLPCAMPPSTLLSWHNLKQIQKMYIRCAILQKTPWHDAQQLRTYSSLTGRKMNIPCAIPPSTLLSWHNIQKKTLNYLSASVPTLCDFPKHTAVMAHTPTIPKSLPKGVCLPKIPKKKLNKQLYVVLQSTWLRECKKLVVWIKSYRSNEAQLCRCSSPMAYCHGPRHQKTNDPSPIPKNGRGPQWPRVADGVPIVFALKFPHTRSRSNISHEFSAL